MKIVNEFKSNNFRKIVVGLSFCALIILATAWQSQAQTKRKSIKPKVQAVTIIINENGYQPSSLRLERGVPTRLTFIRRVEGTCATEVVFPDYGIRRELPLNKAVVVSFTPKKAGEFSFACGMNMVRGKLIVQ